jgi:hypothetical protein
MNLTGLSLITDRVRSPRELGKLHERIKPTLIDGNTDLQKVLGLVQQEPKRGGFLLQECLEPLSLRRFLG